MKKLQNIQNKALRWILNIKWDDFINNQIIHDETNMPTLNTYLDFLAEKQITKLIDLNYYQLEVLDNITPDYWQQLNLFHLFTDEDKPIPDPLY